MVMCLGFLVASVAAVCGFMTEAFGASVMLMLVGFAGFDCYLHPMWFVGVCGCCLAQRCISADVGAAAAAVRSGVPSLLVAVLHVSFPM